METKIGAEIATTTAPDTAYEPESFEDKYEGVEEYSVSGWASWTNPAK